MKLQVNFFCCCFENFLLLILISENNPFLSFKRIYSMTKHVSGHKLVPSIDIYENEKRLRKIWRNHLRDTNPTSPLSISPTSSNILTQSFPTSRLLQLMNNTTNHLSYLAGNLTNSSNQATNPLAELVCDICLKRSTKSLNDYLMDAFKFSKKTEAGLIHSSSQNDNNNPFLVCIYCFFTIHLNCLCKVNIC